MSDYRKLLVWQKAHLLTLAVYRWSAGLPASETYGLASQMRRASSSILMNLAEGSGRSTDRDDSRYVSVAIGSANELEYQLCLADELGFRGAVPIDPIRNQVVEVRRMLFALRKTLSVSDP